MQTHSGDLPLRNPITGIADCGARAASGHAAAAPPSSVMNWRRRRSSMGVHGPRVRALGVEHFGQTGSVRDLYRHYGIDANAIVAAALTPGRPIRHLKALP